MRLNKLIVCTIAAGCLLLRIPAYAAEVAAPAGTPVVLAAENSAVAGMQDMNAAVVNPVNPAAAAAPTTAGNPAAAADTSALSGSNDAAAAAAKPSDEEAVQAPALSTKPAVVHAALAPLPADNAAAMEFAVYAAFTADNAFELIPNLSGKDLVLSMAGGVEVLSSYAVSYTVEGDPASAQGQTTPCSLTLQQVLDGRTLRTGETVKAVYGNGGFFYIIPVTISGQTVTADVPYMTEGAVPPIVSFVVARGAWIPGPGIDYLAIGNSITMHPKRSYWPNAMGMGASSIEKDYFHQVCAGLEKKYRLSAGTLSSAAMNFAIWESSESDRMYALTILDPFLTPQLDIISIQLGENFLDMANFAAQYTQLVSYIRGKCPTAQIVLVGNFWANPEADAIKQQVAQACSCAFVSLEPIQNNKRYFFGNAYAYDAERRAYYSTNGGTALHPNNEAMTFIANGILTALQ